VNNVNNKEDGNLKNDNHKDNDNDDDNDNDNDNEDYDSTPPLVTIRQNSIRDE